MILTSLFSVGICTDIKDVPPVLHRKSQSCILQYANKQTFLAVVTHNPQHHVSYIKTTELYLIFKDSVCKCGLHVWYSRHIECTAYVYKQGDQSWSCYEEAGIRSTVLTVLNKVLCRSSDHVYYKQKASMWFLNVAKDVNKWIRSKFSTIKHLKVPVDSSHVALHD